MQPANRRTLLATLFASAGATAALAQSGSSGPAITPLAKLKRNAKTACLYHCDFGDRARFVQMCNNITNHFDVYSDPKQLELVIVVHSQAVKFFMQTREGTPWAEEKDIDTAFALLEPLALRGLKVYLCEITFKRLKLEIRNARQEPWIIFVPSGVATVGDLQAKGFGYLKVG